MLDSFLGRPGSPIDRGLSMIADACIRRNLSANALTYGAVSLGILSGLLFALGCMWSALLVVVLSGAADAIDGRVARRGSGSTPWGGVMDLTFDRVVEAAVLLGIALPRPEWHVPALVLATTWYINLCVFLAVGAAIRQESVKVIPYAPGLLERSELLVLALVVVLFPGWVPTASYVYAGLVLVTATQRFVYGQHALTDLR
jgi:phosphatidylglycerophosphate synthase